MNFYQEISEEELARIDRYLRNEMDEAERMKFVHQLNNEQQLREKTESTRLMTLAIVEASLEAKLESFHVQDGSTPVRKMHTKKYWAVAASILVLLTIAITWLFTRPSKHEELFAEYFKPDPGLLTSMGASEDYVFNHAMVFYKAGNYKAAINSWQQLRSQDPTNDTLNYFIGIALLSDGISPESEQYFEKVIDDQESSFREDAIWYLALAYLKNHAEDKAIKLLENNPSARNNELLAHLKK